MLLMSWACGDDVVRWWFRIQQCAKSQEEVFVPGESDVSEIVFTFPLFASDSSQEVKAHRQVEGKQALSFAEQRRDDSPYG
ncbi:MAG: hypothetical protein CL912_08385 [Deltaproteobacteria bacterium]|nr:hypothetical protein [Deltaproteobacteria bacterium]